MGSNMAECHPVGFQWVTEARLRGAKVFHVDPRFTRTSAMADRHVAMRPGTDVAFLGGIINHILSNERDFREYVVAYTNASQIVDERLVLPDDADGLFSGYDPETQTYDSSTWEYEGVGLRAAAGRPGPARGARESDGEDEAGPDAEGGESSEEEAAESEEFEAAVTSAHLEDAPRDETLQHPRCVYQILKRHYARYTPEFVEDTCGVPKEQFLEVAEALCANSGRERTSAIVYSVGWTQHTTGVQYIRAASIIQLLLGNVGRPGGGILALRGHASIQGSTDIPTLFDLLPGYLPMPHAHKHPTLAEYVEHGTAKKGFWANTGSYMTSLLKAWWGDAATADNEFGYGWLPRLTGDHGVYRTIMDMADGKVEGYMLFGQNPAVGSSNGRLHRHAMAQLNWLVVRDLVEIESATFWKDAPEIETGELAPEDIGTEVFFLPSASHTEKDGTFTNTQRLLQWHHKALEPKGDCRSDLWFCYHLGRRIRDKLAGSSDPKDRAILDLTWDYPTEGPHDEPDAEAVLAEINGWDADGNPLSMFTDLADDGSTACGCWIYCGCFADGVNQTARRKPGREQSWVAPEWAWAWPDNRRILYNRASADPDGNPWSERKRYVWWDAGEGAWVGEDNPDFVPGLAPDHRPPDDAEGVEAIAGNDPFVMQADGKGWLYAPDGLLDGPLPAHYEPHESPVRNSLYPQQASPVRERFPHPLNPDNPPPDGDDAYPFVLSTYRIAEHHTAGGMSRFGRRLSELAPELFVEVGPELAAERGLEHGDWATIVSSRSAIEARVMVTDRIPSLDVQGRRVHQVGVPYHWGYGGTATGDGGNDLLPVVLDPNVHIGEYKVATCDIRPGRRPRGPSLREFVDSYPRTNDERPPGEP
jgi:formate dehydrogenase major subunit